MLPVGTVIRFIKSKNSDQFVNIDRYWVVLNVTRKMISLGVFAYTVGKHTFGGMWYGDDPLNYRCFGKLTDFSGNHSVYYNKEDRVIHPYRVIGNVNKIPLHHIKCGHNGIWFKHYSKHLHALRAKPYPAESKFY